MTTNLTNVEVLKKLNAEFFYYNDNGEKVLALFKTLAECVYLQDGDEYTSLALQLANMVTSINGKVSSTDVEEIITQKWADEIEGVPEELNSIKELAAAIAENSDIIASINALAAKKVDKLDGHSLVNDEVIAIISSISSGDIEKWGKGEANIVVGATMNGEDVPVDDNKKMTFTSQKFTFGATLPSNPKAGDCHILFED